MTSNILLQSQLLEDDLMATRQKNIQLNHEVLELRHQLAESELSDNTMHGQVDRVRQFYDGVYRDFLQKFNTFGLPSGQVQEIETHLLGLISQEVAIPLENTEAVEFKRALRDKKVEYQLLQQQSRNTQKTMRLERKEMEESASKQIGVLKRQVEGLNEAIYQSKANQVIERAKLWKSHLFEIREGLFYIRQFIFETKSFMQQNHPFAVASQALHMLQTKIDDLKKERDSAKRTVNELRQTLCTVFEGIPFLEKVRHNLGRGNNLESIVASVEALKTRYLELSTQCEVQKEELVEYRLRLSAKKVEHRKVQTDRCWEPAVKDVFVEAPVKSMMPGSNLPTSMFTNRPTTVGAAQSIQNLASPSAGAANQQDTDTCKKQEHMNSPKKVLKSVGVQASLMILPSSASIPQEATLLSMEKNAAVEQIKKVGSAQQVAQEPVSKESPIKNGDSNEQAHQDERDTTKNVKKIDKDGSNQQPIENEKGPPREKEVISSDKEKLSALADPSSEGAHHSGGLPKSSSKFVEKEIDARTILLSYSFRKWIGRFKERNKARLLEALAKRMQEIVGTNTTSPRVQKTRRPMSARCGTDRFGLREKQMFDARHQPRPPSASQVRHHQFPTSTESTKRRTLSGSMIAQVCYPDLHWFQAARSGLEEVQQATTPRDNQVLQMTTARPYSARFRI